jgi:membrane fusion protein, multidrug efflux system
VVIDQIRPILVRFAVPATELSLVQASSARGELPVLASSSAAPTEVQPSPALGDDPSTAPKPAAAAAGPGGAPGAAGPPAGPSPRVPSELGTLSFIDNTVDTTTGTVMLKATFANAAKALWPGQFVAVSVRVYVEQNALVVPARAVLTGQQGAYVYVVDSGGAARQRRVTVERTADTVAVIAWGLNEGDPVVTDGQSRLTPGAKVSTRSAGDSAAPAAPARRKGSQPAP